MIAVDPRDFTPEALRKVAPACGECTGQGASVVELVGGAVIYPHRPDLWQKDGVDRWWWRCENCGAYVGTHQGTINPLGTPCGPETRRAREAAHAAFDPMWRKRMRLSGLKQSVARGRGSPASSKASRAVAATNGWPRRWGSAGRTATSA